jgi:dethiobiotin synthetase
MSRRILVAGTGTNIGKTESTALLVRGARLGGLQAVALKPIESGVVPTEPSDSERLGVAAGHAPRARYRFRAPESPHLAARLEGASIDDGELRRWVDEHAGEVTFIEPAGGLFSPTAVQGSGIDWVALLAVTDAILVAPGRLGVIHDVASTLLAARGAGVPVPWRCVLVTPLEGESLADRKCAELRETAVARWWPGLPILPVPRTDALGFDTVEASRMLWQTVAAALDFAER